MNLITEFQLNSLFNLLFVYLASSYVMSSVMYSQKVIIKK